VKLLGKNELVDIKYTDFLTPPSLPPSLPPSPQDVKLLGNDELVDIKNTDLLAEPVATIKGIYDCFTLGR